METAPAIQNLFPLVNRRFQSFSEAVDTGLDVLARALPGGVAIGQIDPVDGTCRVLETRGSGFGFERGDLLPQNPRGDAELDLEWLREHGLPGCVSLPLELSDGSFVGVLCGLCDDESSYGTEHVILLGLVARMLSLEWERVQSGAELRRLRHRVSADGAIDGETGLLDRTGFSERLDREWGLARRGTVPSLVVAFDLRVEADDPSAADAASHKAVRTAAEVLSGIARSTDYVGRTGPRGLAVAMAGTDDAAGAHALIDRYVEALRRVSRERHAEVFVAAGFHPLADVGSAEQALVLAESAAVEAQARAITAEVGLL